MHSGQHDIPNTIVIARSTGALSEKNGREGSQTTQHSKTAFAIRSAGYNCFSFTCHVKQKRTNYPTLSHIVANALQKQKER
jgi:hypothetical protein